MPTRASRFAEYFRARSQSPEFLALNEDEQEALRKQAKSIYSQLAAADGYINVSGGRVDYGPRAAEITPEEPPKIEFIKPTGALTGLPMPTSVIPPMPQFVPSAPPQDKPWTAKLIEDYVPADYRELASQFAEPAIGLARIPGNLASTAVKAGGAALNLFGRVAPKFVDDAFKAVTDSSIADHGSDVVALGSAIQAANAAAIPFVTPDAESLSDFWRNKTAAEKLRYLTGRGVEQLGTMLPIISGAGIGAAAAEKAAKGAQLGKLESLASALSAVPGSGGTPQAAGALLAGVAQTAGEIAGQQREKYLELDPKSIALGSLVSGKLESVVPGAAEWVAPMLSAPSRHAVRKAAEGGLLSAAGHVARNALSGGVGEFLTEGAQTIVENLAGETPSGVSTPKRIRSFIEEYADEFNKSGLSGVLEKAASDRSVWEVAQAAGLGAFSGSVAGAVGSAKSVADYARSNSKTIDQLVFAPNEKAEQKFDEMGPLPRYVAVHDAGLFALETLLDKDTKKDELEDARMVWGSLPDQMRRAIILNRGKAGNPLTANEVAAVMAVPAAETRLRDLMLEMYPSEQAAPAGADAAARPQQEAKEAAPKEEAVAPATAEQPRRYPWTPPSGPEAGPTTWTAPGTEQVVPPPGMPGVSSPLDSLYSYTAPQPQTQAQAQQPATNENIDAAVRRLRAAVLKMGRRAAQAEAAVALEKAAQQWDGMHPTERTRFSPEYSETPWANIPPATQVTLARAMGWNVPDPRPHIQSAGAEWETMPVIDRMKFADPDTAEMEWDVIPEPVQAKIATAMGYQDESSAQPAQTEPAVRPREPIRPDVVQTLLRRGYSRADINGMTPEVAERLANAPIVEKLQPSERPLVRIAAPPPKSGMVVDGRTAVAPVIDLTKRAKQDQVPRPKPEQPSTPQAPAAQTPAPAGVPKSGTRQVAAKIRQKRAEQQAPAAPAQPATTLSPQAAAEVSPEPAAAPTGRPASQTQQRALRQAAEPEPETTPAKKVAEATEPVQEKQEEPAREPSAKTRRAAREEAIDTIARASLAVLNSRKYRDSMDVMLRLRELSQVPADEFESRLKDTLVGRIIEKSGISPRQLHEAFRITSKPEESERPKKRKAYSTVDEALADLESSSGLTADIVREAFGGNARVDNVETALGPGYMVELPNGKDVVVLANQEIKVDPYLFREGYGRDQLEDERVIGEWTTIDHGGLIRLAKEGGDRPLRHEVFHAAMEMALTPQERKAVLDRYGSEEEAAKAYEGWKPEEQSNGLFRKIFEFFRRLYRKFFPDADIVFERIYRGEVWDRGAPDSTEAIDDATHPARPILPPMHPSIKYSVHTYDYWKAKAEDWMRANGFTEKEIRRHMDVIESTIDPLVLAARKAGIEVMPQSSGWVDVDTSGWSAIKGKDGKWRVRDAEGRALKMDEVVEPKNAEDAIEAARIYAATKDVSSPIRDNSDELYFISFDLSSICSKRAKAGPLVDALVERLGRSLSDSEMRAVVFELRARKDEAPCMYCYVETTRAKAANLLDRFVKHALSDTPWRIGMDIGDGTLGQSSLDFVVSKLGLISIAHSLFDGQPWKPRAAEWIDKLLDEYRDKDGKPFSRERRAEKRSVLMKKLDELPQKKNIATILEYGSGIYDGKLDSSIIDPKYFINMEYRAKASADPDHPSNKYPALYRILQLQYSGGNANTPKPYSEYRGQLLAELDPNAPPSHKYDGQNLLQYLNDRAGVRFQSSSDFQIEHAIDVMQALSDLAAIGAKSHIYTKIADYARIFGPSRQKVNLSIFCTSPDPDENGDFRADTTQGVDWEVAKQLRKSYPDVGTILVATSDAQILWALDQDWIDQIIPYHSSQMPVEVFEQLGWKNYEAHQHEKPKSKTAHGVDIRHVDIVRKARQIIKRGGKPVASDETAFTDEELTKAYLALCDDLGMYPVFWNTVNEDIRNHPRYAKLRKDYARTDTPFVPVQAKFDTKVAEKLLRQWLESGGAAAQIARNAADPDLVDQLANEFEAARAEGRDIGAEKLAKLIGEKPTQAEAEPKRPSKSDVFSAIKEKMSPEQRRSSKVSEVAEAIRRRKKESSNDDDDLPPRPPRRPRSVPPTESAAEEGPAYSTEFVTSRPTRFSQGGEAEQAKRAENFDVDTEAYAKFILMQGLGGLGLDVVDSSEIEGIAPNASGAIIGDTIYIFRDKIKNSRHLDLVMAHEIVGHFGFYKVAGDMRDKILDDIANELETSKDERVIRLREELQERYGDLERSRMAEEAIAIMAEKHLGSDSLWQKIVNAVNRFLRWIGFDRPFSLDEVRSMLRQFKATTKMSVEGLEVGPRRNAEVRPRTDIAFAENVPSDQTETPEFKRWFGDSKVVDESGNPLQVYHGTTAPEFTVFGGPGDLSSLGWHYFTDSQEYAEHFGPPAESNIVRWREKTSVSEAYPDRTVETEAHPTIVPGLVVVRQPNVSGDGNTYHITHEPSGFRIGPDYSDRHDIEQAVKELGKVGVDWTAGRDVISALPQNTKKKIATILKQYESAWLDRMFGYAIDRIGVPGRVMKTYLRIENPIDLTSLGARRISAKAMREALAKYGIDIDPVKFMMGGRKVYQYLNNPEFAKELRRQAIDRGYDGITMIDVIEGNKRTIRGRTWIAFRPEQIKSATDNVGTFDINNPDIRFSRDPLRMEEGIEEPREDEERESAPQALAKLAKAGLGTLLSEIAKEAPEFQLALERNPNARTTEEMHRRTLARTQDLTAKAQDYILSRHIRRDNSRLIDMIMRHTQAGPMQDWLLKKARRVIAPFWTADKLQRFLFNIAERVYWDAEKGQLMPSPGRRVKSTDGKRYIYKADETFGEAAMLAFEQLSQEWKDVLIERAKKNEEYRQNFVNFWLPQRRIQVGLAILGHLIRDAGESPTADQRAEFAKEVAKIKADLRRLSGREDIADRVNKWRETLEGMTELFGSKSAKKVGALLSDSADAKEGLRALRTEQGLLETNQGHYGYVHHQGFKNPGRTDPGSGFDANGRLVHPWFKETAASEKLRENRSGYEENLLNADLAQARKKIRADVLNQWMAEMEDTYGLPFEDYTADTLPEGYDIKAHVVANFGKHAGHKIFLPKRVVETYRMAVERGTIDPEIEEFSEALGVANDIVNRVNEAMLYHPAKFMRDLFSSVFHTTEFIRDYVWKNPKEAKYLPKVMWTALKGTFSPDVWQRLTPESFGEYSEPVSGVSWDKTHWTTRVADKVGGYPLGSVIGNLLREINLAGAGDIPIKRFFTLVGEQLADIKGLKGAERERFIYGLMNAYAFDTADLPPLLAFMRGKRPDRGSKTLGVMTRAVTPFMGYAYRLAHQMVLSPFKVGVVEGLIPAAAGTIGIGSGPSVDTKVWTSELARPIFWAFVMSLVRGGLGGLIPPEDEEIAGALQNRPNIDPMARTATRVLVAKDESPEGGEYYMSTKGLGQLGTAETLLQVARGKMTLGDAMAETFTIHPFARLVSSMFGLTDPYTKDIPKMAQLGQTLGMAMLPQSTRAGQEIAKFFRLLQADKTIPDARKDDFFTAFLRQVGFPVGTARVDKDGTIITTSEGIEALKLLGVNLRYIPYRIVETEAKKEVSSLKTLADKLRKIEAYKAGKWRNPDGKVPSETEFLNDIQVYGRGTTVETAEQALKEEIAARESGVKQAISRLRKVGIIVPEEPEKRKRPQAAGIVGSTGKRSRAAELIAERIRASMRRK